MATDEFKALLDRTRSIDQARALIEAACPLLRELVNHATWAFQRCQMTSDQLGGPDEDLAVFTLYRHLIELTDGVEVLLSSSCVDATVPLIRASFEASLSLDYIMRDDYRRRSLSWACCYIHDRLARYELLDGSTESGREFVEVFEKETDGSLDKFERFDIATARARLASVLEREHFRPMEGEYQCLRTKDRFPEWFRMFGGPSSRRRLARAVGREAEYMALYQQWSGFSHATDASAYLTTGEHPEEPAFWQVRVARHMPHRAFFAAQHLLRGTRLMIEHFRPGEDISRWYQREVQAAYINLSRLRIEVKDSFKANT